MASVAAMSIREQAAQALGSDRRLAFLSKLAWEFVIANRGSYPAPDTDAYQRVGAFVCLNEILHSLTSQLWSDLDHGQGGYSDRALVENMFGKSRVWHCEEACREAFRRAIEQNTSRSSASDTNGSTDFLEPALAALAPDHRETFLTELFFQLTVAARSIRPPSDPDLAPFIARFVCHNQLLYHVAGQLRADLGAVPVARHDLELIETLVSTANSGRCGGDLRSAFERTLAAIAPSASRSNLPVAVVPE